jgi:hypothetical protein
MTDQTTNNTSNDNLPKEITWEALEYPEYKKHPLWFLGFAVFIALVVIYGIFTGSWSTVVTFILFGVMGVYFAAQKPKMLNITLSGSGIHVNTLNYPYSVIKKFWIIYLPGEVKSLYLETSALFNHIVKLELHEQDPLVIKKFLKQYLEEDLDNTESVADLIARRIKF